MRGVYPKKKYATSFKLRVEGAQIFLNIGKNIRTFKMAWGKIFVPLEEYIPPGTFEDVLEDKFDEIIACKIASELFSY